MDVQQLLWLFFGFSGRVNRAAYALAGLFLLLVQFFLVYRIAMTPEASTANTFWGGIFLIAAGVALVSNIALAVKRLHDFGKPGLIAILFVVAGVIMYLVLCFIPGDPGPNKYGQRTNAPR
ncbi:MAG: DUF805 domain-containing protein [Rhizobiaceae bacterium]|nr:DUF805 domain-containing protein [Rhizobiaceae bacterium]MCV0404789.1 DUF805 domain-containing protein [Rhizobiaceae bacterium]